MSFFPRVFIVIAILFTICCKGKIEVLPPIDLKKDYFPLKLGSRIIYQADSTVYSSFSGGTTVFKFELKDSIASQITESGRPSVLVNRYKRTPPQNWAYQKSMTRTLVELRAEEFTDNIRYVRFTFPPDVNKIWNGNTYNSLGEQTYKIAGIDQKQSINGILLDSTATVIQINETNLIREDYAAETYARHIGLVKREVRAFNKDISSGKITQGYKYLMEVKSFQ